MPFEIVRNDITKMKTDAIVNAANTSLKMGGGVCGAIFSAAGSHALQEPCDQIGHCDVGSAVQTKAFSLDANYIIHTVGPVWQSGENHEEQLLRSCYGNSLKLAHQLGCKSISFPLISTGIFGYPKEPALQIAVSAIEEFLADHEMHIYLVVFDKRSFGISKNRYQSIAAFIDENEVRILEEQDMRYRKKSDNEHVFYSPEIEISLDDVLGNLDESFSARLFRFIDEKGMTDIETYKKANIDRKLFSKIRNSPNYTPMKKTIIAFAVALELDLLETEELLEKAGYRLSKSHKFDLIILYFIERKNYNIYEINEALFAFDQVLLGA
ncbi:Appr-1-p processing domain protein [Planococcus donghaensis MPA1U2]|uniref:Appr-1-p processing domain protein n=1 Tax=Planococcus donghaensis MPA1U2 TaxID=933115 RepID=E7RD36_9BACL|nr:macro domain-containing protein [Planococcus donghaensis]EGA91100.1 Appr-1-p processing domain protein [Planococcus donghaensis MPA1U2]